MAHPGRVKRRWRRPAVYTIALVVAVVAGATGVFLVGSSNRRSDRASVAAYERALLPAIREGGRIVQQEMKPSLGEVADGKISDQQLLERAAAWRRAFERVRADILALEPPGFLDDVETRWRAAMDGYLATVQAFEAIARSDPSDREASLNRAAEAADRADDLFDRAAELIQFHRRRLGLDPSTNLPDPSPTLP